MRQDVSREHLFLPIAFWHIISPVTTIPSAPSSSTRPNMSSVPISKRIYRFGVWLLNNAPTVSKRKLKSVRAKAVGAPGAVLVANTPAAHPVGVYFSGEFYQLGQWLPALEALNEMHPVCIVTRERSMFNAVRNATRLTVLHCATLVQLQDVYEASAFRCLLYMNNAAKNFQSLMERDSVHVHLNHGESEKSSMYSNQAKAYDYLFVVGEAGRDRYTTHLKRFNADKIRMIGRPQLDGLEKAEIGETGGRPVVIYAPTWEGNHAAMDYSSVGSTGLSIVEQIVKADRYHLLYRPHPGTGLTSKAVGEANEAIRALVATSEHAEMATTQEINSLFATVDLGVFDTSSVMVDFLLRDKPMLLTRHYSVAEERSGDVANVPKARVVEASVLLCEEPEKDLDAVLQRELQRDTRRAVRRQTKEYYLGQFADGESTQLFIRLVDQILTDGDLEASAEDELPPRPVPAPKAVAS